MTGDSGDFDALTETERVAYVCDGVVPNGWRWCPDCNGEGEISMMDTSPDLNESFYDCMTCAATYGIIPKEVTDVC